MTGKMTQRKMDGTLTYPYLEVAMAEAVVQEVENYVAHRQNTVENFITKRPIMDLCLAALWRPGSWVSNMWWEQEGIYLEGIKEAAQTE